MPVKALRQRSTLICCKCKSMARLQNEVTYAAVDQPQGAALRDAGRRIQLRKQCSVRGDRLHLSNIAYSVLNQNQNSIPNPKPMNLQIAQHHVPAPYAHVQILTIKALDEGTGEGVEHVSQESLEHCGKMGGRGQGDVQEKSAQECNAWMKAFLLEKAAAVGVQDHYDASLDIRISRPLFFIFIRSANRKFLWRVFMLFTALVLTRTAALLFQFTLLPSSRIESYRATNR